MFSSSARTVLLFLTVASSHALKEDPSSSDLFDQFLVEHGKEYNNQDEYNRRQEIFLHNLETIIKHNNNAKRGTESSKSKSKSNYTMAVNTFADMLPNELPLGYDKSLHSAWKATKKSSSSTSVERKLGFEDAEMDSPQKKNRVSFCQNNNIDWMCCVILFGDADTGVMSSYNLFVALYFLI